MSKTETLFSRMRDESASEQRDHTDQGGWFNQENLMKHLIVICTVAICTVCFPMNSTVEYEFGVGTTWRGATVVAEYPFPVAKTSAQFSADVLSARERVAPVCIERPNMERVTRQALDLYFAPFVVEKMNVDSIALAYNYSRETMNTLQVMQLPRRKAMVETLTTMLMTFQAKVYQHGFVNEARSSIATPDIIVQLSSLQETAFATAQVYDSSSYRIAGEQFIRESTPALYAPIAQHVLTTRLMVPNIIVSQELTQQAREQVVQSVPRTLGIVHKGETIVSKGEVITDMTALKLSSYQNTRALTNQGISSTLRIIGNFGHTTLIVTMLMIYLFFLRERIYRDNRKLAGLCTLLVIAAINARLVAFTENTPMQFLIFTPIFSMLTSILYDSRTANHFNLAMGLLVAGIMGNNYDVAIAVITSGTFAAFTVRDMKSRTQIFKSIFSIFAALVVCILCIGIEHATHISELLQYLVYAVINAVSSPLLTLAALYTIERTFKQTTDLLLTEYDSLNHELLVQLSEKAPGTYQHTLMVARLAETACLAIGANSSLAKVGAYFHDIGKMVKPEYFIENQLDIGNKHERLSPYKSAKFIREHVEEGLRLAAEYKLPDRIVEFIPMHHGTMLIAYFYNKAVEDAKDKQDEVNEKEFRYDGPIPNSKETGVVMLADAVEAISHVVDTNNEELLEARIDAIFKDRIQDGQLDESGLTIGDLANIKETFMRNLKGTAHQRVEYKQPVQEESTHTSEEA